MSARAPWIATFGLVLGLMAVGQASPAWAKPVTPPAGDSGEQSRIVVPLPSLTLAEKQVVAAKDSAAAKAIAKTSSPSVAKAGMTLAPAVASAVILQNVYQEVQTTSYNCGPASLVSIARSYGSAVTQSQAARDLGTTTSGTDWSNATGSPMKIQLNRYSGGFSYVVVALAYTPTAADKTNFRNRLVSNVNGGHAISGDAVEVYNGPHLIGHPNRTATIYHWFAIEGYGDGGASTHYADSVAGASSISWSSSVAPYNWISSDQVTTIMGARGYIW